MAINNPGANSIYNGVHNYLSTSICHGIDLIGTSGPVGSVYVPENGTDFYVTENGADNYVPEA